MTLHLAFISRDDDEFVGNLLVFIKHIVPGSKQSNWFLCRQRCLDTDGNERLMIVSYAMDDLKASGNEYIPRRESLHELFNPMPFSESGEAWNGGSDEDKMDIL